MHAQNNIYWTQKLVYSNIPEVFQVSVNVLILQQLTPDEVVTQAKLRHGQYMSFVGQGVARGPHQVIPALSTGKTLTKHHKRGRKGGYVLGQSQRQKQNHFLSQMCELSARWKTLTSCMFPYFHMFPYFSP